MLVALSVFGVVLVGLIGLLVGSMSAGTTAETFSIASGLARQRLEQVTQDIVRFGASAAYPSAVTVAGRPYAFTTTLTDLGNNMVNIEVRVDYQVSYASACAPGVAPGSESCVGNVRTYFRTLEGRARRP